MFDLFNFHHSTSLIGPSWFWLLAALILGIIVGYMTCSRDAR
jgi:hypothetical protein